MHSLVYSSTAGALVPLGFLDPLPIKNDDKSKPDTTLRKALRLSYQVVAILSLMSELVSVMWATVAVNQLTETQVAPAQSVWYERKQSMSLA
jgi:hypothetical protein